MQLETRRRYGNRLRVLSLRDFMRRLAEWVALGLSRPVDGRPCRKTSKAHATLPGTGSVWHITAVPSRAKQRH